jgi:hypothetical protein
MPPNPVRVPRDIVDSIFDSLGILGKIDRGLLLTRRISTGRAKAAYAGGGSSSICLHFRRDGTHIATTHELVTPWGETVHRHGKDILIGETKFIADTE